MVDKRKKDDITIKHVLIHVTEEEHEELEKYKKKKKLTWKKLLQKGMNDS